MSSLCYIFVITGELDSEISSSDDDDFEGDDVNDFIEHDESDDDDDNGDYKSSEESSESSDDSDESSDSSSSSASGSNSGSDAAANDSKTHKGQMLNNKKAIVATGKKIYHFNGNRCHRKEIHQFIRSKDAKEVQEWTLGTYQPYLSRQQPCLCND